MKDQIGFMKEVKTEVEELFSFLKEFEKETGTKLILVLFVDDLDRCMDGRCVNVLEAIQLILSIPGSPVIVFLAVDARIIVSAIESVFNRSLNPENFEVSGWEYLDKIVQLPFSLPLVPPLKVKRFMASAAETKQDLTIQAVLKKVQNVITAAGSFESSDNVIFEFPRRGELQPTRRSLFTITPYTAKLRLLHNSSSNSSADTKCSSSRIDFVSSVRASATLTTQNLGVYPKSSSSS